jgi:hypothetical protein
MIDRTYALKTYALKTYALKTYALEDKNQLRQRLWIQVTF